jgi:hypothetical protein
VFLKCRALVLSDSATTVLVCWLICYSRPDCEYFQKAFRCYVLRSRKVTYLIRFHQNPTNWLLVHQPFPTVSVTTLTFRGIFRSKIQIIILKHASVPTWSRTSSRRGSVSEASTRGFRLWKINYFRLYRVFRAQADWTFILPSDLPMKELRHLPRKIPPKAYQTSQYVVPRGGIFLGKWRSTFAGSPDGKLNVQSVSAVNTLYYSGRLSWIIEDKKSGSIVYDWQ